MTECSARQLIICVTIFIFKFFEKEKQTVESDPISINQLIKPRIN